MVQSIFVFFLLIFTLSPIGAAQAGPVAIQHTASVDVSQAALTALPEPIAKAASITITVDLGSSLAEALIAQAMQSRLSHYLALTLQDWVLRIGTCIAQWFGWSSTPVPSDEVTSKPWDDEDRPKAINIILHL